MPVGPIQILLILLVIGGIFLFVKWRNSQDKNNIKKDILASAPRKKCAACQTENDSGSKFCKQCGGQEFK